MNRLPVPPPADPLPLVERWIADAIAHGARRNPTAMTLATVGSEGRPSARMVLLKELSPEHGYCVFFTHYGSRKGQELDHNPVAAAVLHWDDLGRQLRFEGRVLRSPAAESDAYFASRAWRSQLNAWTSAQSVAVATPELLEQRAKEKARELGLPDPTDEAEPVSGTTVPRPPFWGGYRLWLDALELWLEGRDRFHERLCYRRTLTRSSEHAFRGGPWTHQWLQP